MFGASNPEWLAKGLSEDAFGGGFMGRTIYVFQDEGKKIPWPERPTDMDELETRITNDLMRINELSGEFSITDEAKAYYHDWYMQFNPDFNSRMSGFYERKPDHILKLAMILAVAESDKLELNKDHIRLGIKLLDEVEGLMPSAFAYIGATNEARTSQHVIELIAGSPHKFIAYKNLLKGMRHMIKNRREFDDMLDTLEVTGQIKVQLSGSARYYTIDKDITARLKIEEARAEEDAKIEFQASKKQRLSIPLDSPEVKTVAEKEAVKTTTEQAALQLKNALQNIMVDTKGEESVQ
jgi:hypothetical protein